MYDYGRGYGDTQRVESVASTSARRGGRRWLLIGALALAFAFTLGAGAFIGSTFLGNAQAASLLGGSGTTQALAFTASNPGPQGQCDALTVSSVSGSMIVAKNANGNSVTIHTTASTTYTRDGQAATASTVTVGAQIHVRGTTNSDGSITATAIDVR
jgi:hypothetical protein